MKKFRINDGDETYEITELEDEDEIVEQCSDPCPSR